MLAHVWEAPRLNIGLHIFIYFLYVSLKSSMSVQGLGLLFKKYDPWAEKFDRALRAINYYGLGAKIQQLAIGFKESLKQAEGDFRSDQVPLYLDHL